MKTVSKCTSTVQHCDVQKYNGDWWVGRLVREGSTSEAYFIPSPSKLRTIHKKEQTERKTSASHLMVSHSRL